MFWDLWKTSKKAGKQFFTGIVTAVNSVGNYDVKIMPRAHAISGIPFFSDIKLNVDDTVKIGYIDHDPQKPVILGFGNNTTSTIINVGGESDFSPCLYYFGNFRNTGMVPFTGEDLPQTLSGEVHHEFPAGEEPGFCDGTYIYGNKKAYNLFGNFISDAVDYSGTEMYSQIPSLIQETIKANIKLQDSNKLLFDSDYYEHWVSHISGNYRYRFFATTETGNPDYSSYIWFAKDNLLTGETTTSNIYHNLVYGALDFPKISYQPLTSCPYCISKHIVAADGTVTLSLASWENWNNPTLSEISKIGTSRNFGITPIIRKNGDNWEVDHLFYDYGYMWMSEWMDVYYSENSGAWTQTMNQENSNYVPLLEWGMGEDPVFSRENYLTQPKKFSETVPPLWAGFQDAGSGDALGLYGLHRITNSDYRFNWDRTENRNTYFPSGQFQYYLMNYKLDISFTNTVYLPFSSTDLEIHPLGGEAWNYYMKYYEINIFAFSTDSFVYFPYEDHQNNKIGVIGIDCINNEIVYHYQQNVVEDQWPGNGQQKLWCYGKYLAFNAGDCWKIIK